MSRTPLRPLALGAALLLALAPSVARAQGWTGGQAGSFTGYNPFSIVGNVLTVTQGADTFVTSAGGGLSNNLLLGIRGIWLVDSSGNAIAGLTTSSGNGVLGFDWAQNTGGYTSENGFAPKNHWITLQSPSVMQGYGKANGTGYTSGVFTFAPLPAKYSIGIDYLVGDLAPSGPGATDGTTKTGRVYFDSIPEPGTFALIALGLAAGALLRRRR